MLDIHATSATTSPLVLSDQLLTMAEAADRAGMRRQARSLLRLALNVCETAPVIHGRVN